MARHRQSGQAIMLSKRSCVFYLEHARVMQKDDRVIYFIEDGSAIEKGFNLPDKNTIFILLGKGTSITDAAIRKLAESNVMVGFCGSGGSPLFGAVDLMFLPPQDEYRPTEYAQKWMERWVDEKSRVALGKVLLEKRVDTTKICWKRRGIELPPEIVEQLERAVKVADSTTKLLSAEGIWAKSLYSCLSTRHKMPFSRAEGKRRKHTKEDLINSFLDHGNYIAYGYAASSLHCLGIPFCFPILHGKTRRGALVFDIADLIKDGLVMPLAFYHGANMSDPQTFRRDVISHMHDFGVMDHLIGIIKEMCQNPL